MTPTTPDLPAPLQKGGWLGSRLARAWFSLRVLRLCALRLLSDWVTNRPRLARPNQAACSGGELHLWPHVVGESITRLWTASAGGDSDLVAGKVQNLRVAAPQLNSLAVPVGSTFSFWKAIGRPTRRRGFVMGRELREGCLIASVGGGLCQLSNALYAAALDAGLEIVERHAHTQIVPGSLAELGRDATVFWNYVDLRFRNHADFVINATLSDDCLRVQIRCKQAPEKRIDASPSKRSAAGAVIPVLSGDSARDCMACVQTACVENLQPASTGWRTAYLLDVAWPEYDLWIGARIQLGDRILVPLNGALRRKKNYHWGFLAGRGAQCIEHAGLTACRSLVSRLLPPQGAWRQRCLLVMDAAFARAYARQLPADARHIVVSITLLAPLWRLGVLGGRSYDVLMTRAPLTMLHEGLDLAAQLHPNSPTLQDFRASADDLYAEEQALAGANTLITPHQAVADFVGERFGARVERLSWSYQRSQHMDVQPASKASKVMFPASALGRKGAYEVREACRVLGVPLQCLGSAEDSADFWQGVSLHPVNAGNLFDDALCVVLPAFVEHRPSILLQALGGKVPVICSPECGIPADTPNVQWVRSGSVADLVAAIRNLQHSGHAEFAISDSAS